MCSVGTEWELIPFKVGNLVYPNCVTVWGPAKKWPAKMFFSGSRNHWAKRNIYQKALQVLHKILMKMKYPTNLKAWILHLQMFHHYKYFIISSAIIPNTSLTANLVFFLRFKDAETYSPPRRNGSLRMARKWIAP